MGFADGFFVNDKVHQLKLIAMIRKFQPEIVLCNAFDDRHIDHPKGSKLASDACFLSGLIKVQTMDDQGNEQGPWRPSKVYHYMQWKNVAPDFVVDVSGYLDQKLAAVFAYKTQFHQQDSNEPVTPISTTNFKDSLTYRAQDLGRLIGTAHAEGYNVERYVAVKSLSDLI
jgi:bacillithiol biosynthesis deacetylase BshB1